MRSLKRRSPGIPNDCRDSLDPNAFDKAPAVHMGQAQKLDF